MGVPCHAFRRPSPRGISFLSGVDHERIKVFTEKFFLCRLFIKVRLLENQEPGSHSVKSRRPRRFMRGSERLSTVCEK
jgi:hypothetical protein